MSRICTFVLPQNGEIIGPGRRHRPLRHEYLAEGAALDALAQPQVVSVPTRSARA